MALPAFVQAGAGVTATAGTTTVSITGCTAGNIVICHLLNDGTTYDRSNGTETNWQNLAGAPSSHSVIIESTEVGAPATATHSAYIGRATANGTVSLDLVTGASGEDVFARMYEFSGVIGGTTLATTIENGGGIQADVADTDTSCTDSTVITNGLQRLALNFVSINASQATVAFTGQSGGTWIEAVSEFIGGGTVGTIQLQIASMPTAATIDGGSFAIASAAYGTIGTALIPATTTGPGDDPPIGFLGRGAGW